jgi:hypothetical protein
VIITAVDSVAGSAGTVIAAGSKYRHASSGGAATVNQLAGYTIVAIGAPVTGSVIEQFASGGIELGSGTGGGSVGLAVGAGVGEAVGFGVALGLGLGLGAFDGVGLGLALGAAAEGLGDGSGADGRTRATSRLPLRSWSMTESARGSIRPTPCSAARKSVSWVITSSAQAIRVVASGPIAAIDSLVV